MSRKVLASIEDAFGTNCVDLFVREDGTHGFELFRSEWDGDARWQSLKRFEHLVFLSREEALRGAESQIPWLAPGGTGVDRPRARVNEVAFLLLAESRYKQGNNRVVQ